MVSDEFYSIPMAEKKQGEDMAGKTKKIIKRRTVHLFYKDICVYREKKD